MTTTTNPHPDNAEESPGLVRCDNCGRYGWHTSERCPTTPHPDAQLTDVGPATPPPSWCLPDAQPQWDLLTEEFGGGTACRWTRTVPADDKAADVWIEAEDRIIDGRVMRSAPRIMMFEPPAEGVTCVQAREVAAALLEAADELDRLQ